MNESSLIGTTEKFLGSIMHKNLEADNIHSLETFMEIYSYLMENLDKLYVLRSTMEMKGYKTPYRSIIKYGRVSSGEMMVEDLHDITRHTQYFRMKAAAKKNILDRVKSSIASHKIAIGHLEEAFIIKCVSCKNRYERHHLSRLISRKCDCGSFHLELEFNKQGISRLEIIKYLPLSGEYMVRMSKLSPFGREAFRKIVRILKQEKRGIVKTLSLVIKVFEEGHWVRKRVHLDAKQQINYEREIRKKYGSNARIEFLQFHRNRPAIINDKHVQTALSLAYVKYAEKQGHRMYPILLKESIENPGKLKIYDAARKTAKSSSVKIGYLEDITKLEKELISNKLTEDGLIKNGMLDYELQKDLTQREKLQKTIYVDISRTLILWDIIRYYLSTSYDRRSKYSGPFPYLRPTLDKSQVEALKDIPENLVDILKRFLNEKIEFINNINRVVSGKFDLERKIKGLHLKMDPPAVGAAIIHTQGKLSIEKSASIFSVNPSLVIKELDKIETFQKPSTEKAQKFLEIIKG